MKFLLELGFEVLESVITCYEYGIFPFEDGLYNLYGYGSLVYSYFWGDLGLFVGWF